MSWRLPSRGDGRPRTRTILLYNDFWVDLPRDLPECPCVYRLTTHPAEIVHADAVLFHIPTLRDLPRGKGWRGQKWVGFSQESETNYPELRFPPFMRAFDLTMTYRWDSDVPVPYLDTGMGEKLVQAPKPKTQPVPAVYFASNARDRSGRNDYVQELMKHMPVDSYGKCLRNRTLEDDRGRQTKLDTIARYRFTLAFENSIATDYVTEKFYDPLIAGSVPVYMGAPNVRDFAPAEHSFIDTRDFAGPRELAEYLSQVIAHPEQYAGFLAWKRAGITNPSFRRMLEWRAVHPLCRLCKKLRRGFGI